MVVEKGQAPFMGQSLQVYSVVHAKRIVYLPPNIMEHIYHSDSLSPLRPCHPLVRLVFLVTLGKHQKGCPKTFSLSNYVSRALMEKPMPLVRLESSMTLNPDFWRCRSNCVHTHPDLDKSVSANALLRGKQGSILVISQKVIDELTKIKEKLHLPCSYKTPLDITQMDRDVSNYYYKRFTLCSRILLP